MSRVLELCEGLPIKRVMAGETLMSQGGTKVMMAVLKEGKVEIIKDGQQIDVIDEEGSVFGEMAVILKSNHTATVHAIETSDFYLIEDPHQFLWERAEFNFELLTILANRLEKIDRDFADFKHRSKTEHEAVALVESMIQEISHRKPQN